jgi:hypothetical protein
VSSGSAGRTRSYKGRKACMHNKGGRVNGWMEQSQSSTANQMVFFGGLSALTRCFLLPAYKLFSFRNITSRVRWDRSDRAHFWRTGWRGTFIAIPYPSPSSLLYATVSVYNPRISRAHSTISTACIVCAFFVLPADADQTTERVRLGYRFFCEYA